MIVVHDIINHQVFEMIVYSWKFPRPLLTLVFSVLCTRYMYYKLTNLAYRHILHLDSVLGIILQPTKCGFSAYLKHLDPRVMLSLGA